MVKRQERVARLARDREVVASKLPLGTVEREIDGAVAWFYQLENELGHSFEFATFFDGTFYQSLPVKPVGLEKIVLKQGGHLPHWFTDGYCCLGQNGGVATLEEAFPKTAMWAYNMSAYLSTGEWVFLNK